MRSLAFRCVSSSEIFRLTVERGMARRREAAERLYARQPALAGAAAADGGRPAEDVLAALPDTNWHDVTGEFFLTA